MVLAANERLNEIKDSQEDTKAMLEIASENIKCFYDRGVKDTPKFENGNLIWLDIKNIKQCQPN